MNEMIFGIKKSSVAVILLIAIVSLIAVEFVFHWKQFSDQEIISSSKFTNSRQLLGYQELIFSARLKPIDGASNMIQVDVYYPIRENFTVVKEEDYQRPITKWYGKIDLSIKIWDKYGHDVTHGSDKMIEKFQLKKNVSTNMIDLIIDPSAISNDMMLKYGSLSFMVHDNNQQPNLSLWSNQEIPNFKINLDLPPEIRWKSMINYFQQNKTDVFENFKMLARVVEQHIERKSINISGYQQSIKKEYLEEMIAFANQTGLTQQQIIFLQLNYELSKACKTFVTLFKQKYPSIIRILEWNMPVVPGSYSDVVLLKQLVVTIEFTNRRKKVIAKGTTFFGYFGFLTAMSTNRIALAINARFGEVVSLQNIPIAFLIRQIITDVSMDFKKAKKKLRQTKLAKGAYIIIVGTQEMEGCVEARDSNTSATMKERCLSDGTPYLYQGNRDIDESLIEPFKHIAGNCAKQKNCKESMLWKAISQKEFSEGSVYATYMSPYNGRYETRI